MSGADAPISGTTDPTASYQIDGGTTLWSSRVPALRAQPGWPIVPLAPQHCVHAPYAVPSLTQAYPGSATVPLLHAWLTPVFAGQYVVTAFALHPPAYSSVFAQQYE